MKKFVWVCVFAILTWSRGGIQANVVDLDTGTELFDSVYRYTRWLGPPVISADNATIRALTPEEYLSFCALPLDDVDTWSGGTADILILDPRYNELGPGYPETCFGVHGDWWSGRYLLAWCKIAKNVIFFASGEERGRTHVNHLLDTETPPDCAILAARGNYSMIDAVVKMNGTLRVSLSLDPDKWQETYDQQWVQIVVRVIFPGIYMFILIKGMQYAQKRYQTGKLLRLHILIYTLDLPVMAILFISGITGGSHFLSRGHSARWEAFVLTEFFAGSCSADLALALMYSNVVRELTTLLLNSNKSKRSGDLTVMQAVSLVGVTLFGVATDFLAAYSYTNVSLTALLYEFLLPFSMIIVQIGAIIFLVKRNLLILKVLNAASQTFVGTGNMELNLGMYFARYERHLRFCSYLSIAASVLNIACFVMFGLKLAYATPSLWVFFSLAYKSCRVVNTWARIYACYPLQSDISNFSTVTWSSDRSSPGSTRKVAPKPQSPSLVPSTGISSQG